MTSHLIALSHKQGTTHTVQVFTPEQADTLFELAKPGDTLHSVQPSEYSSIILQQVREQLAQGRYKEL